MPDISKIYASDKHAQKRLSVYWKRKVSAWIKIWITPAVSTTMIITI